MQSRAGTGTAGSAKSARDAATKELEKAASMLWPEAMQRALRAGADVSDTEQGVMHQYDYVVPRPVSWVITAAPCAEMNDSELEHDDEFMDVQRAAALRVLVQHGVLEVRGAANSALLEAVGCDCGPAVMRCLIDAGANPAELEAGHDDDSDIDDVSDDVCFIGSGYRRPPLLHLIDRVNTVQVLLAAGASATAVYWQGNTPLHNLWEDYSPKKQKGLVAALVAAGADVNARNNAGETPLGAGALAWCNIPPRLSAVRELLACGADPCIANNAGARPVDVARRYLAMAISDATSADQAYAAARRSGVKSCVAIMRLLLRETAWWRRRHLLEAIRLR